jgi:hypothetical protein
MEPRGPKITTIATNLKGVIDVIGTGPAMEVLTATEIGSDVIEAEIE